MTTDSFVLKGDIVYSLDPQRLSCTEGGYLVCDEGLCAGVFAAGELPGRFADLEVRDFCGQLIIPGLVDLHTHAPQFPNRGLGMDLELLDWLDTYTFPEESRYADLTYARLAYEDFVAELMRGATTRAVVFATLHVPATLLLMELLEDTGLSTLVGKLNMDRNSLPTLVERDALASLDATRQWLNAVAERGFRCTAPILTPRFVPSCSDSLLVGLGALQREFGLPVQSHLSENLAEIAWVRELCPDAASYAEAYLRTGLLGGEGCPTIMAHCVYSDPLETPLLKEQGVWIAHCPVSNTCVSSGIAPVRSYLDQGLRVGLGTDVSGGYSLSLLHSMAEAIKVSKLRWRLVDDGLKPLSVAEAFYLATLGGGSFFGKVGSFEPGFCFDAVVLEDIRRPTDSDLDLEARLERLIYADANDRVLGKYVNGQQIL
ncbi:MAG: amidohydrolase family protein [Coriobacteriia bacterium]|nr:amidohydrolase family protein [Coriobacteriia bacterium]